ncbi:hypothetical protein [Nocardia sp. NPDC057668]|uniref:hypothetical protein n=1 Tax=Nocardia sp. NPDC057668 TaxID=3346202 RepID=UPI00366D9AA7
MSMWDYHPGALSWADVDPATHEFDADEAAGVIGALPPPDSADPERWVVSVSEAVGERYGVWAYGWAWGCDESDFGGGPISEWCCLRHSVGEPDETVARTVRALVEWRGWLERLARRFGELGVPPGSSESRITVWEDAIPLLVTEVVAQTNAGDAWYRHAAQVLGWFLAREGVSPDFADALVHSAIGGRFQSWVGPDQAVVADVAERVADGFFESDA